MALQHLRSSTANKRPDPTAMAAGQLAINNEATSPGLFFKDSAGNLVKVGPVHVGTTAPNATPASGGTAGNSTGEIWLDTTGGAYDVKVWDGSGWRSQAGEFVNITGDTMTGDLTMGNQSDLRFGEATANGSNWVAFQAPATVASNVTWTLPAADGTSGQVLGTDGSGTLSWTTTAKLDVAQTFTAVQTLTDPAIIGTILEDVYTITDGAAFEIDPGNGSVQLITLGASRTPKATNFAAGEAVTLMVDDGTAYTLTWTDATFGGSGVVWKTGGGNAPTLNTTGYTVIVLWKVGTQVYGARVGDA